TTYARASVSLCRSLGKRHEPLGFAKHRQRQLGLRIRRNQVAASVGDAKEGFINTKANHRLDEIEVFGKSGFVDLEVIVDELLAEFRDHCIVHGEVPGDRSSPRSSERHAGIALRTELLRVVLEFLPPVEQTAKRRWIESFDLPGDVLV